MTEVVKDPVCGMTVDTSTAAGKSVYNGTTYYFSSLDCKASFDKDPSKYIISGAGAKSVDSPPIVRH